MDSYLEAHTKKMGILLLVDLIKNHVSICNNC